MIYQYRSRSNNVLLVLLISAFGFIVSLPQEQIYNDDYEALDNTCDEEGRFRHPDDCGSFLDCIHLENGTMLQRKGTCNGFQFNSYTKQCTTTRATCSTRSARALVANHNLDYACGKNQTGFICSDCKTLVNCLNGTAYPEPCGNGFLCYESDIFGGGVCYPGRPDECLCSKPNEFQIDKYDNHSFFFCENMNQDPAVYRCPEDMEFDKTNHQCYNVDGLPPCSKIGVFANPNDCSYYYTCIMSTEGWVHKRFSCLNESQPNFMFNDATGRCEDPCTWKTGVFVCTSEGRFPDPSNCNQYYECISLPGDPTQFRKTLRECPTNFEWDPEARGGVGHCVSKDARVSTCEIVTPNQCAIPAGVCGDGVRSVDDFLI